MEGSSRHSSCRHIKFWLIPSPKMFEFIFGYYSAISAFARAWHGHDWCVVKLTKKGLRSLNFLSPWGDKKYILSSYADFLQRPLQMGIFLLLQLQFSAQQDALHDDLCSYTPNTTHETNTPIVRLLSQS